MNLNFESLGNGPPIVILHGLFGSIRNWQRVAKHLESNYRVISMDVRNHGGSPHATEMDYESLANDVLSTCRNIGIEKPTIIGHSMGGKIAMTLALTAPEMVAHLIVVDIAPRRSRNDYGAMLSAMSAMNLQQISRRSDADRQLARHIPETEVRLFILQNLIFTREAPPRWRINLAAIQTGIDDLLQPVPRLGATQFEGESDFIRGIRSDHICDEDLALIEQNFPNYRLTTINRAGHWPHVENAAEFLTAIDQVLARNTRSDQPQQGVN